MIRLELDESRSKRAGTFNVARAGALWCIEAFIETDSGKVLPIVVYAQEHDRGESRRRAPDGRPALLLHRADAGHAEIEPVRLHPELHFASVALGGWSPPIKGERGC